MKKRVVLTHDKAPFVERLSTLLRTEGHEVVSADPAFAGLAPSESIECSSVRNVRDELLASLPKLRAFATSLCGQSGGGTARRRSDPRNRAEGVDTYWLIRAGLKHDRLVVQDSAQ
jgi:hypothetical protein